MKQSWIYKPIILTAIKPNYYYTCQCELTTTAAKCWSSYLHALYLMDSRQGSFVPVDHSSPPSRPSPSESSLGLKIKERETACSRLPQLQDSSLWHDILLLDFSCVLNDKTFHLQTTSKYFTIGCLKCFHWRKSLTSSAVLSS